MVSKMRRIGCGGCLTFRSGAIRSSRAERNTGGKVFRFPNRRHWSYEAAVGEDRFSTSNYKRRADSHLGIIAAAASPPRNPLRCLQRPEGAGRLEPRLRIFDEGLP